MKSISPDMAKLTSDRVQVRVYMFLGVQTTYAFQKTFYHKGCDLQTLQGFATPNLPEWVAEKNRLSSVYAKLLVSDIVAPCFPALAQYLNGYRFCADDAVLGAHLCPDDFRQYLLYNIKLKSFIHAMEIVFDFPAAYFTDGGVITLRDADGESVDLYNCLRNGIVRISDGPVSDFVTQAEEAAFSKIAEIFSVSYGLTLRKDQMLATTDSGNITVVTAHKNQIQAQAICDTVFATNRAAERIEYFDNDAHLYNCDCLFNGRFQSIVTASPERQFHFIPITYQAQFTWSYLSMLSNTIENLNLALQSKKHAELSVENKHLISAMIEKNQILAYEDEMFKRSIENEYDLVYKKFEDAWHLDSSLQAQEKYISNLSDYLNRAHMEESEHINLRQNKTLFIISLLQILAFISIWSDFLDLGAEYGDPIVHWLGIDFSGVLQVLSMILPLVLVIITTALAISSFRKK